MVNTLKYNFINELKDVMMMLNNKNIKTNLDLVKRSDKLPILKLNIYLDNKSELSINLLFDDNMIKYDLKYYLASPISTDDFVSFEAGFKEEDMFFDEIYPSGDILGDIVDMVCLTKETNELKIADIENIISLINDSDFILHLKSLSKIIDINISKFSNFLDKYLSYFIEEGTSFSFNLERNNIGDNVEDTLYIKQDFKENYSLLIAYNFNHEYITFIYNEKSIYTSLNIFKSYNIQENDPRIKPFNKILLNTKIIESSKFMKFTYFGKFNFDDNLDIFISDIHHFFEAEGFRIIREHKLFPHSKSSETIEDLIRKVRNHDKKPNGFVELEDGTIENCFIDIEFEDNDDDDNDTDFGELFQ